MFSGFKPTFGDLENDLAQLGVDFAKQFVKEIARSAKDGYHTTKRLM